MGGIGHQVVGVVGIVGAVGGTIGIVGVMSMRRGDRPGRPPGIEAVGRGYGAGKPFFVESMVVCSSSPGASFKPLVGLIEPEISRI